MMSVYSCVFFLFLCQTSFNSRFELGFGGVSAARAVSDSFFFVGWGILLAPCQWEETSRAEQEMIFSVETRRHELLFAAEWTRADSSE